jgi:hypothetical protein
MRPSNVFQMTLETARIYSEILHNIYGVEGNGKAKNQLLELITDVVDELHTNCRGQVA